jgi:polyisoprenoid-binding protein YceI
MERETIDEMSSETKTRSGRRVVALLLVAAVVVAGAFVVWRVFGGETPEEAGLSSTTPSSGGAAEPAGGFEGAWAVDTASGSLADGTSTFAGYRIDEELSGFGTNTAVGRTGDVTGELSVEGTSVTALAVTVDMTTLRSDDERRDGQLSERGLETDAFPTATFVLTSPIEIGAAPGVGEPIEATATGELTLHGVTREVEVPVEAQWTGERLEVVGSFDVTLADYEIEPPVGFLVLSVADTGTVELHLLFEKA